jgi:DNA-binding helix-hairpin-helix protein with protein kinase domain
LGRPLSLATSLGKGGEGAVYEVQGRPDFVAKIYHKPIDPDKALKLQIMASQSDAQLTQYAAWPVFTIHETPGAGMVGFAMPRASGFVPIHHLYGPTPREEKFPRADWAFLIHAARNAAVAFHVLHSRGHVVGDVNEINVLV